MLRRLVLSLVGLFQITPSFAFELDIKSLRTTLSRPDTSHTLIFRDPLVPEQKSVFLLEPTNNERLGFFLDVNGIEVGYAADIYKDEVETKTQNFLFSYRKLKHSKITLNLQRLEGLETRAENLSGAGLEGRFLGETTSTKIELFGQHNFYTFGDGESLFEHFFLNRPKLSDGFDWALSVVGGWSIKHLSLENAESILFSPDFIEQPVDPVTKLDSYSINADVGPFISISLPNNFHLFAEYKFGRGHIENIDAETGLKESGGEKANAFGGGLSWTSQNKKWLVLLRGWEQKGRHIKTSFGDLSVVRFF